MKTNVSEFPKHPLPAIPQPSTPQHLPMQQPTIYVYEKPTWEYKVVSRSVTDDALGDDELNALGAKGWELVGVVSLARQVQFYFKRART